MIQGKKIFNKVLVANRGEIAVRIFRTLKAMGITSVAVFSSIEKDALHVKMADEAYELTGNSLAETYLDIQKIVHIAIHSGCDAIHPGYGFLSENPAFAESVVNAGINFIGPPADIIALMGNKAIARKTVSEIKVPVIPGYEGTASDLLLKANELNYPLLIKAQAGGGGRAMRIVHSISDMAESLESVSREAMNYFGDDNLYAEKFFTNARHIEIQVMADHYGDILILGERDCSLQRRYQKVIEESPSTFLTAETRERLNKSALEIVKHIGYVNAGTLEFLVDENQNFYFLEMNTRIQVEHPVTEMVTSLDLVELQLYVAAGNALGLGQYDIRFQGHAIEARIYAEDPAEEFLPSPGPVYSYREPSMPGLRIDSSINCESYIHPEYDPMIAKVVFHASSRDEAITGLRKALSEFVVSGTRTNREFLIELLDSNGFLSNEISTRFIDEKLQKIITDLQELKNSVSTIKIIAAWLGATYFRNIPNVSGNIWSFLGEWRHILHKSLIFRGEQYNVIVHTSDQNTLTFRIGDEIHILTLKSLDRSGIIFELDGEWSYASVVSKRAPVDIVFLNGYEYEIKTMDFLPVEPVLEEEDFSVSLGPKIIKSPLHGKILKINISQSANIKKGEVLFILDAMKIENKIIAPVNGCIKEIKVFEGEQVRMGQVLVVIDSCGVGTDTN